MKLFIILASCFVFVAATNYWPWDPRAKTDRPRNLVFIENKRKEFTDVFEIGSGLTSPQRQVNEIKRLLFNAEQKMQMFCRKNTDRPLKEAYGATHYRLYANMTGCKEAGIEVRAGQRLVAVQARDSRCDSISLRMLPDVVDSNSAFWRFKNGQINILFPYRSEVHPRRCRRVISDKIHSVPMFVDDLEFPDVDVRLGDESLGKALMSFSANNGEGRDHSEYQDSD